MENDSRLDLHKELVGAYRNSSGGCQHCREWLYDLVVFRLTVVSLGAINLLPIPILDGEHIVFHSLEGLLGRPVPEQIQIMSYQVGLLAVFTLMVFAIYNDVARL